MRSVKDKRTKKRRKFGGRKERLREQVKILKAEKEAVLSKNAELFQDNKHLKR